MTVRSGLPPVPLLDTSVAPGQRQTAKLPIDGRCSNSDANYRMTMRAFNGLYSA